jgi:tetratricopeptide (TPR) repeat protein
MPAKKTKKVSMQAAAKKAAEGAATPAKAGKNGKRPIVMTSIYWAAIATFAGSACYMLSHHDMRRAAETADTIQVTSDKYQSPEAKAGGTDDAGEYLVSGQQKLLAGDSVGALNDFTLAIEKNPTAMAYIYRGEMLMNGANFDAAIADFNAALQLDAVSAIAYYDRALTNIKLENLDEAQADLSEAIEAAELRSDQLTVISLHDMYAKRAQTKLWLRDWSAAADDYTAAISQNAGEPDWNDYTGRAEARTNIGDYEAAISDYVSAVTIISERIQKTPDEKTREDMSRQAMGYFEKSGALRVKIGDMDSAKQDLQAAHTLAIALNDMENKSRLEILISSIK